MNNVLLILFLFYMGSIFGWVLELFFRRLINENKKWVNPGFLIGPYLPIYGFGLTILFLIARLEIFIHISNDIVKKIILFAVMAAAMTAVEYIAGVIFIKKMKVKLWDYGNMWGNVQGIICPLYSLFWAVLGAVYYLFVDKFVITILTDIFTNTVLAFGVGIFYGFFIIDLVYSLNIMVKIRKFAQENNIVVKIQELKLNIIKSREAAKKKRRIMFALSSSSNISYYLLKYKETLKKFEGEFKRRNKK